MKNSDIFHISAQNIDCWGGSNEYPQSMFLSRNKKNNVYPCIPQFYYIKKTRGGSNEYPQSMFWVELWKISGFFYLKIFIFWW